MTLKNEIARSSYNALKWSREKVPFGIRSIMGIVLMVAGIFGFLPILGFWMFPLGVAFIALDIPFTQKRVDRFMIKLKSMSQVSKD
ncbi:hypothetical protein OAL14_01725 [Gammaproteobacteria bacterium]|nr:hypothetical protein [Gammaproteobacteria bacterium]